MNFLTISPLVFGAGLAALAVALFVLQQLRIRYTQLYVPTTLFWAEAVRDAPVRVFRHQFKHWLAYLLALLICCLLWLGFSDFRTNNSSTGDFHAFVLDASAGASVGNEFNSSKQQLLNDIGSFSKEHREVYVSSGRNLKVLSPGEETLLLERRLANIEPESAPSAIEDLVRILVRGVEEEERIFVNIYGRTSIPQEVRDQLPDNVTVNWQLPTNEESKNRGIVALGIGEPISGAWNKVDVLLRVIDSAGEEIPVSELTLTLDDQVLDATTLTQLNKTDFILYDVPADGSVLQVSLSGEDDVAFDNEARVALPLKKTIRVAVGDSVPSSLLMALGADDALQVVSTTDEAEVAVLGTEDAESSLPTFKVVPIDSQDYAFVIGIDGGEDAELVLRAAVESLGLRNIDAVSLATELNRPIEVQMEIGDSRSISMWDAIVQDEFNFRDSFSFPLFVSKSMRYLASEPPWYAYLAAGKPAIEQSAGTSLANTDVLGEMAAGTYFVRNEAGEFEIIDQLPGVVSLLDTAVTTRNTSQGVVSEAGINTPIYPRWAILTWLMLLVFGLVIAEWYIYQRRLMP